MLCVQGMEWQMGNLSVERPQRVQRRNKAVGCEENRAYVRIKQCTDDRKIRLSLRRLETQNKTEKKVHVNDSVKFSKKDETVVCSRKSIEKLVKEVSKLNKTRIFRNW